MTLTNIHHAGQALGNAGQNTVVQAVITYHGKPVLLNGRNFDQVEVDAFAPHISHDGRDTWLKDDPSHGLVLSPPAEALDTPVIHNSRAVGPEFRDSIDRTGDNTSDFAFIIIVRRRNAAAVTKARVLYTRSAVGGALLEEASQGHSTVFSAALLRSDLERLTERSVRFKKATSKETLSEPSAAGVVPLLC